MTAAYYIPTCTMCICIYIYICICTSWLHMQYSDAYGVATISRILEIIGLFCKPALQKRLYSVRETYNFQEPTNRSHPMSSFTTNVRLTTPRHLQLHVTRKGNLKQTYLKTYGLFRHGVAKYEFVFRHPKFLYTRYISPYPVACRFYAISDGPPLVTLDNMQYVKET